MRTKGTGRGCSPPKGPQPTNSHLVRIRCSLGGEGAQNQGPKEKVAARRPPGLGWVRKSCWRLAREAGARRGFPRATPARDERRKAPPTPHPPSWPSQSWGDGAPRADTRSYTSSSLRARGARADPDLASGPPPSSPRRTPNSAG